MKLHWGLSLILVLGIAAVSFGTGEAHSAESAEKKITIPDTEEVAVLETTKGPIVVQFFPDVAPGHVNNFKKLSKEKFYDGVKFHRIIKGFMIQTGCPNTKKSKDTRTWGTGDPGYKIKAEFNKKPHLRGVLSMARSRDPNSAGSQFFICHGEAKFLDNQYTVFGKTVVGLDVVDLIVKQETKPNAGGEVSLPVKPDSIKKASIMTWKASQDYLK